MKPSDDHYIRIQLKHDYLPNSNPYPADLEKALKALNLPFIGGTEKNEQEAVIRHETGPELILLVTSLVTLGSELIKLYSTWRKERPETKIQITVSSAKELEKVLKTLKSQ
jgi:hypothetical protein